MNVSPDLAAGCIASLDPLITLTKREPHLPMGLAPTRPDLFADKPGLHLVGLTWSCESDWLMGQIAADYARATAALPRATVVVVANTQMESFYLSRAGIPNLFANELIFTDERLFTVLPAQSQDLARFDAIYVARLDPEKRHELAAAIPSVVLTHGPPPPGGEARVRRLLPQARFANFEDTGGTYWYLKDAELVSLMNRSAVGLCLSAKEGSMRVSMEYRLAGSPVVSTRSIGGRDRYFMGPHVRIVDDNPDAVAAAVRELKAQRFSRQAVREYVGQLVAFDRQNFLLNLNKLIEWHLGVRDCFRSFAPFMRHPVQWRSPAQILAPLTAAASAR
jgi:glycosyltransferase involved in cell wall biosynthesis